MFSLAAIAHAWDAFLWAPTSVLPLVAFRIALGAALLWEGIRILPHCANLYAADGILGPALERAKRPRAIDFLSPLAKSRKGIVLFFVAHCLVCVLLIVGFATNLSAFLIYLNFASRRTRAVPWFHGGDGVAVYTALFVAFSPAGSAVSVDSLLGLSIFGANTPPIAFRLLQLFVCFVYVRTWQWKAIRRMWIDGTALFRSLFRSNYARPSPYNERVLSFVIISQLGTWFALAVEAVLPFGFWFDETRRAAVVANTALHFGIMTMFRMKAFQWIMMATGALFLSDAEVAWAVRHVASLLGLHAG